MTRLRSLSLFALGAWTGTAGAAALVKRAVPSVGDEDSDALSLVAVFDGIELTSRSRAFTGGSMLAWFGGIAVDLRGAELAPGARLSVTALFGGISVKTPPGWRIDSRVHALLGGIDVRTPTVNDPDAPVLLVEGRTVLGGVAIGAAEFSPAG